MSDPGAILKNESPAQFCRYDTGSSVGNPYVPEGDLNTQTGEISLDQEIHALGIGSGLMRSGV